MKKTNKGFSLVELIIVIAIMAILAGAIAPALIKYIDKSRKSNDVSSAKAIKTAVETALGTESVYEKLVPQGSGSTKLLFKAGQPCQVLSTNSNAASNILVSGSNTGTEYISDGQAVSVIGAAIGEKIPKIKYKKTQMKNFIAEINDKGTVIVGVTKADAVGSATVEVQLAPEVDEDYQ